MRGRKPAATFGRGERHLAETATIATNNGVYVVESLRVGLYYFLEDNDVVIATSNGFMKMELDVAETIAAEFGGIINDFKQNKRDGREPMDSRAIGNMLGV